MEKTMKDTGMALYPGYSLLFLFDNATSHSIYADNALCTTWINKKSGRKQVWLCNGWYEKDENHIEQPMSYQGLNNFSVQKKIQQVLEKRSL